MMLLKRAETVQFCSVESLSRVQLFVTPWTTARQASLSFTISQNLLKLMSIDSVMLSNHLIRCRHTQISQTGRETSIFKIPTPSDLHIRTSDTFEVCHSVPLLLD